MAYRCLECGHIFEEGEQARWSESRGEYWGTPCSEEMSGCPICKGEYEETTPCEICGSEHLEYELTGGVCDECVENYKYDIEMCYKVGEECKEDVELNGFLVSIFGKCKIESILWRELLKQQEKNGHVDCTPFIESDRDLFSERLVEEVKKNENGKN